MSGTGTGKAAVGAAPTGAAGVAVEPGPGLGNRAAAAYRATGLAVIEGFFDASAIAELAREADRLFECFRRSELSPERIATRPARDGSKIFERIDPVCDLSQPMSRIARDSRLLDLVAEILGDEPFLFKDKLIYKFPGDAGYGLHQDYPYFFGLLGNVSDAAATVAIVIDPVSPENGGLQFYLGCHGAVQPAPKGEPNDVDPRALAGASVWDQTAATGSLILFHTLTPHQSGPNRSAETRRLLYLTYTGRRHAGLRADYYRRRAGAASAGAR